MSLLYHSHDIVVKGGSKPQKQTFQYHEFFAIIERVGEDLRSEKGETVDE